MKKLFLILTITILLSGCNNQTEQQNSMFDESGNLKEKYARAMQEEWCNYNKGNHIITNQCDGIN